MTHFIFKESFKIGCIMHCRQPTLWLFVISVENIEQMHQ